MKKLLVITGLLAVAAGAFAQGNFNFSNGAAGVNAKVTDPATGLGVAAPYVADLLWGPVGTAVDSLTPAGYNVAVSGVPGYFQGGSRAVGGTASSITGVMAVWNPGDGTFAQAKVKPGAWWGWSAPITITLVTPPTPDKNMVGLTAFQLTQNVVPEPSTFALAGLGAAALLIFRRRK